MGRLTMKAVLAILLLALPCWAGGQEKKGGPVDLIPKADLPATPAEVGWKAAGKALVASAGFPVREVLTFNYEPIPEEYDLTLVVERMDDGKKDFAVGLPTASAVCAYHFDTWDATKNSVALIDGQEGESAPGQTFKKGKPRTVKLSVRKDGLTVDVDGKKFWKGKIAWAKCSTVSAIKADKSKLFLVASGGDWKVSAFMISPTLRQ